MLVLRVITWSLFKLRAPNLVKYSTWPFIWWCQFIDLFLSFSLNLKFAPVPYATPKWPIIETHRGYYRGTQWICSSKYLFFRHIFALLAGRCGRKNSPWKESVAGKKIIQGVRGDLKSRIAATGHLYALLTTQDLNCALWNFPISQVAGCKFAGWELFHQSCWEWGTDNFFPAISQNA